jgi:hypothetical protein
MTWNSRSGINDEFWKMWNIDCDIKRKMELLDKLNITTYNEIVQLVDKAFGAGLESGRKEADKIYSNNEINTGDTNE